MKFIMQKNLLVVPLLSLTLGGCVTTEVLDSKGNVIGTEPEAILSEPKLKAESAQPAPDRSKGTAAINDDKQLFPGTGKFVNQAVLPSRLDANVDKGKVTLNFENADISQVARVIFGKVLKNSYIIDPGIKGQITIQTTRPMSTESVLDVLEDILKIHGAKLLLRNGVYEIVPESKLMLGNIGVGKNYAREGYGYQIVPLEYISAKEMSKILESITSKENLVRIDEQRNLLILAGNAPDLITMTDMVNIFDIDWLSGKSVALIDVQYTNVDTLTSELENIFALGKDGPMKGMLQFMPIERVNAILVISTQPAYLYRVKDWASRLDRPSGGDGKKFYVYPVKNGNAEEMAATLNQLFTFEQKDKNTSMVKKEVTLAPDLSPMTAVSPMVNNATKNQPARATTQKIPSDSSEEKSTFDGDTGELSGIDTRIIAAQDTNSLLIFASPTDYQKIESAIGKLDVAPLQVLVEATILDLRLTGDFAYGVQWFFHNKIGNNYRGNGQVGSDLAFASTLSYSVTDVAGVLRGMLRSLASEGKVNVLSSPSLMVRNNQSASIRVGDQQPISTALVSQEGSVVATSVQFKDTGVMLEVTPRINADGMISLNVSQEVTDVGEIDDATGQRSFLKRSISSSVAINSGETLVLGGLIRENKAFVKSGVPLLKDIPILGALFGQTVTSSTRTELIVMLTPRIVRNVNEARLVTEEYRRKLTNLEYFNIQHDDHQPSN